MGVPAFFRWLTKKYPSIIVNCIEDNPSTGQLFHSCFFLKIFFIYFSDAQGVYHPLDETRANPNGIEVNFNKFSNI
jgi:hypothetical protein